MRIASVVRPIQPQTLTQNFRRRLRRFKDPLGIAYQLRTLPNLEAEYREGIYKSHESSNQLEEYALSHDGLPFTKSWHYFGFYDQHLGRIARASREGSDDKPLKILEIGVWQGGSLQLWRRYFGNSATIFGIDVDPRCLDLDGLSACVRIGSQVDGDFLRDVVAEMGGVDIVIDDGSHNCSHVIKSFEALFPLLGDGGFYFVEDLHTSYWPQWRGGLRRPGTSIEFFKDLVDVVNSDSFRRAPLRGDKSDLAREARSVEFVDSMVLVRKGKRERARILYGGVHEPGYLASWGALGADWRGRGGSYAGPSGHEVAAQD